MSACALLQVQHTQIFITSCQDNRYDGEEPDSIMSFSGFLHAPRVHLVRLGTELGQCKCNHDLCIAQAECLPLPHLVPAGLWARAGQAAERSCRWATACRTGPPGPAGCRCQILLPTPLPLSEGEVGSLAERVPPAGAGGAAVPPRSPPMSMTGCAASSVLRSGVQLAVVLLTDSMEGFLCKLNCGAAQE